MADEGRAGLNAVQRLDLAEEIVGLAARAIVLGHPRRDVLGRFNVDALLARCSDKALVNGSQRLKTWLAAQNALTAGVN